MGSSKIRIGIIGAGNIGGVHIREFSKLADSCEITEITDAYLPLAQAKAQEYGMAFNEWLPTADCNSDKLLIKSDENAQVVLKDRLFCLAPWQQLFVGWDGKVYPHCLCVQDGFDPLKQVGDVLEDSLEEMWNGERMRTFRSRLRNNDYKGLCCKNCVKGLIPDSAKGFSSKA